MSRVVKINLNGGVKRIVSTLICLMMVLATFPMHMLKNTISADGGDLIPLELGKTVQDGSEVKDWMTAGEALADANTVQSAGDINITLSNDITVTDADNQMGDSYLFNFTGDKFAGKTITIDGKGHSIKIDNEDLFFLQLENCTVILKNITIDGGWNGQGSGLSRQGAFICVRKVSQSDNSELEIGEGTTIKNCKNSSTEINGGAIFNDGGTVTMNDVSITNCSAQSGAVIYTNGGMITINGGNITNCFVSQNGGVVWGVNEIVTINGGSIANCRAKFGGAIHSNKQLTINGGSITNCSAVENGGAIWSSGKLIINGISITNCSAGKKGGGISIRRNGQAKINSGSIINCHATCGDAISNIAALYLPPKESGFLTIILTNNCCMKNGKYTGTQQCDHNTTTNLDQVMGYEGIHSAKETDEDCDPEIYPNYKIVFVDSESGSTVGVAYGNKPMDPQSPEDDEKITVPDSVSNRPGYEFAGWSYTKTGDKVETQIEDINDYKFTLNDDMLKDALSGVVTLKVTYNKLYTVQYIYDGKVVGTKSGCSDKTTWVTIISDTFGNITLDDSKKLDSVVKLGEGYTFSNFTYGKENKEVVLEPSEGQTATTWENLKASAIDNVITIILNYTDGGTVKYVANGCMILDEKSKLTNYSGVNLPIGGLQKVPKPGNVIFDFCHHTIHHNDPNVSFIQTEAGQNITICNLKMDGSGCK